MKKNTTNPKPEFTLFHLVIIGIFIVSLAIRVYGAYSIKFTNAEAEVLLSLSNIKASGSANLFYGLIIKIVQFLGVNSDLGHKICQCNHGGIDYNFPRFVLSGNWETNCHHCFSILSL